VSAVNDILDTTVIGSLPGETTVDQDLLAGVLQEVAVATARPGLEGALAIAEAVLDRLFGGDVRSFRATSRSHETFRALQTHPDLGMSKSALWYALAVHEQLGVLPRPLAMALPLSHHKVLLTVEGTAEKLALARRAHRENLSRRDLERIVRKAPATVVRGPGRPPMPAVVKGLRLLQQALSLATSEPVSARALRHLDRDGVSGLLRQLDRQRSTLDRLRSDLEHLATEE